jgi:hypothetical protein
LWRYLLANMFVVQIVTVLAICAGETYVCVSGLIGCVGRVCDGICLLLAMQIVQGWLWLYKSFRKQN